MSGKVTSVGALWDPSAPYSRYIHLSPVTAIQYARVVCLYPPLAGGCRTLADQELSLFELTPLFHHKPRVMSLYPKLVKSCRTLSLPRVTSPFYRCVCFVYPRCHFFTPNLVQSLHTKRSRVETAPNATNPRHFQIRFQYILDHSVSFGANLPRFGTVSCFFMCLRA